MLKLYLRFRFLNKKNGEKIIGRFFRSDQMAGSRVLTFRRYNKKKGSRAKKCQRKQKLKLGKKEMIRSGRLRGERRKKTIVSL